MPDDLDDFDRRILGLMQEDASRSTAEIAELVGMSPSAYRRRESDATEGIPSCVARQVTRPVRNREAPAAEPQPA